MTTKPKCPKKCENCANWCGKECRVLSDIEPKKPTCVFQATQEQLNDGIRKAFARIAKMDKLEQDSIAERYYGNCRPWLREA